MFLLSAVFTLSNCPQSPSNLYQPELAEAACRKILGEHYNQAQLAKWTDSDITLFRSDISQGLWYRGIVVSCYRGIVVSWCCGIVVLWYCGIVVL